MPPVVARKLMASRSQQSSANATRTRSPLSQPISTAILQLPRLSLQGLVGKLLFIHSDCDALRCPEACKCFEHELGQLRGITARSNRTGGSIEEAVSTLKRAMAI